MMDFGKAFTYVFEDKNWIMKVLVGGLISLIPIFGWIVVIGYMLTTLKNVADGQPEPLPEWGNFGDFFMKGLYAFVGVLVYFLPVIVLSCCIGVLSAVAGGAMGSTSSGSSAQAASGTLASIVGILSICVNCIVGLYSLVAGLTLYAPLTRFAMTQNQLSVFWDFRGNFAFIQKNAANYVIALVVAWVASFVAGFGIILCLIGVLFTSFWSSMVAAHAFGQMWRQAQGAGTAA
jgi:hypothetical protein